ncbi:MAG: hypothetical protein C0523_06400 [Cytophaga sp.]|nr:hypothetical protein [Cytophaga sp.]
MKSNLPRAVFAINTLIDSNNERFQFYKEAASSARDMELKLLFMKYAIQAQSFTTYLNSWLSAYGAVYTPATARTLSFSKLWNQLKRSIALDERQLALKECEQLERNTLKKYQTSLAMSFFPAEAETDIKKQLNELQTAFQGINEVRIAFSRSLQIA